MKALARAMRVDDAIMRWAKSAYLKFDKSTRGAINNFAGPIDGPTLFSGSASENKFQLEA